MKKSLSIILALIMVLSMSTVALGYSVDVTYTGNGTTSNDPSSNTGTSDGKPSDSEGGTNSDPDGYYTITVPRDPLVPGADAQNVTLEGIWGANIRIDITADEEVTLSDGATTLDPLVVTFAPISQVGKNVYATGETLSVSSGVSVANFADGKAPAFGTWTGVVKFYVDVVELTITPSEPETISFTIGGNSYEAENGMTWGEWVGSNYNIDGYTSQANKIKQNNVMMYVSVLPDIFVKPSDEIVNDAAYILKEYNDPT